MFKITVGAFVNLWYQSIQLLLYVASTQFERTIYNVLIIYIYRFWCTLNLYNINNADLYLWCLVVFNIFMLHISDIFVLWPGNCHCITQWIEVEVIGWTSDVWWNGICINLSSDLSLKFIALVIYLCSGMVFV